jgi:hypothetical protein
VTTRGGRAGAGARQGKRKRAQTRGAVSGVKGRVAELGSPSNSKKKRYKPIQSDEVTSEPPPAEMAGRAGRST